VEEEAEAEEIVDASDEIQATGAATALFPWLGSNLVAHRWKLMSRLKNTRAHNLITILIPN
jgi:hypothetical protein